MPFQLLFFDVRRTLFSIAHIARIGTSAHLRNIYPPKGGYKYMRAQGPLRTKASARRKGVCDD